MANSKKNGNGGARHWGIGTRLTHVGRNPSEYFGFVNPPLYRGSTILYPSVEALKSRSQAYTYGRRGTPTVRALEDSISELEGGAHTVLTSSGLSACAIATFCAVGSGGHVLITDSVYQPVRKIGDGILKRFGVDVTYYDPNIGAGIADLIKDNTQLIYTETPGSQTFEVQDLPAIVKAAKPRGVPVLADNTWGSPLFFNPLALGADIVVHAGTKYFSGHSDVNLGSVTVTEDLAGQLRSSHGDLGQCPGAEDAQLCLRGLRTLALRLAHHQDAALDMARWFAQRDEVARVLHPALNDHPGHEIWKRDFSGSTGLFSIVLKKAPEASVTAMLDGLELFGMGASWGGYESLALPFDPTSYRTATKWQAEGPCIRYFIGLEDLDDLKADLDAGFERMKAAA
jgi:cystathionine beta-lyase